jgi:predicted dehydrogenase
MTITAGIVGCGHISRFHFSGLEKAGVKLKWICDLSSEAAAPWVEKFDASFTTDYQDIVADSDVDLMVVAAVSPLHKVMCTAAIAAGKAVICEKTLAENAEDSAGIVKMAEEQQTILYTSYMKRFIPAVQQAKELMPSLGQVMSTYIRTYQFWGDIWTKTPTEGLFYTPPGGVSRVKKNFGGGILTCGGSHMLDLVVFFLGRPSRLFSSMYFPEGRDYELQASVLMETDNGTVHFESLGHPLKKIGFLQDGWDERIEINGTEGRLEIYSSSWNEFDVKPSKLIHYDNQTGRRTEYLYDPVSPFDRAIEFFCGNIAKGEQGSQSRVTGYDVDELISHIKLSASEGRAVDVEWRI